MKKMLSWVAALVNDPGAVKPSSNRVLSLVCGLAGVVFAFVHPDAPDMALVLLGAAGVSTAFRTKGGDK